MTVTTRQYTDSQNEAVRTTPAMETEPVIRLMQAADRTAIADIIRRTWHYDEFCDSRTAQCLADVFLSSVEADSDRAMVLTLKNQVLGAIMIQDKRIRHRSWTGRLRQGAAIFRLLLTKEGRRAAQLFGNVDDTDSILLKRAQKSYGGEIRFFALDESVRGQGLGKVLFDHARQVMRDRGIQSYYLYTDTSCSWQFYRKQGMRQAASEHRIMEAAGRKTPMTFFLFDALVN